MKPKQGIKYKLSCYNYNCEGIYLGKSRKIKRNNKHFILANTNPGEEKLYSYFPLIGAQDVKVLEEKKLELYFASGSKYFPKITPLEQEYLNELGKKIWRK